MRGKASCLRREKRPTHLMCVVGASIKQQSVWRKEETFFLFFFFVIKKGRKRSHSQTKGRAVINICF